MSDFDKWFNALDSKHGNNGNDELLCRETWDFQQQKINLMQEMIDGLWQDCLSQDEIESWEIRDMLEQLEKQLGALG